MIYSWLAKGCIETIAASHPVSIPNIRDGANWFDIAGDISDAVA
jgi:hypothetical protein